MAYLNTHTRTTTPTKNDFFQPTGRTPALFGVFVGFIRDASDVQRNGRLKVWIPEFGSAPDKEEGWILANYCSPFAGATNIDTASRSDKESFEGTQTSYGMWMIPPDYNNQVLIMFINGDPGRAIWIGCLYNQYMNNMVPAMAADAKNWQHPGKIIPIAEYNKWNSSVTEPDRAIKPYEKTKFKGVGNQGLINDQGRGVTNTSARREAPSNVFGIITPGPVIDEKMKERANRHTVRRKGGSSFIMDDGDGTEYVELATKSGAKIRLDETNGFVYIINRDGTAWMQMDQQGHIDVFSQFDISIRAQRDVNIRADRDVNIESGQNTYISAAKDTITNSNLDITYDINNKPKTFDVPYYSKCARGLGYGGNIVFSAEWDIHSTVVQHNYYNTTLGTLKGCASNSPSICQTGIPDGTQHYWSENNFIASTNKNFHFWAHCSPPDPKLCLAPNISGNFFLKAEGNYNLTVLKVLPICGDGDIKIYCDGTYNLTSKKSQNHDIIDVGTYNFKGEDINIEKTVTIDEDIDINGILKANDGNFTILKADTSHAQSRFGPLPVPPAIPPDSPESVLVPAPLQPKPPLNAIQAEQKGLNTAGNILPPIKEPFFTRGMQGWPTIVSRWPTYEPCPLHEQFKFSSTTGYTVELNEADKTYAGSANGGATQSPPPNTTTGANNTTLPPPAPSDSITGKDFNVKALQCQLKIHEGEKLVSYKDSKGLPTGGIGHLLRTDEISKYPIGTPISQDQVDTWFAQDSQTCIKDAQNFIGTETWEKLDEPRKRALADMAFNMGSARLSQFKTFKKEMQAGNYDQAAKQIENTPYYQQVGRRGPAIASQIRNGTDLYGCGAKNPMVKPAG